MRALSALALTESIPLTLNMRITHVICADSLITPPLLVEQTFEKNERQKGNVASLHVFISHAHHSRDRNKERERKSEVDSDD